MSSKYLRDSSYIDGKWFNSKSNRYFDVLNPATGTILSRVNDIEPTDVELAIQAAERAFPSWSKMTSKERASIMRRFYELIIENADELAAILTQEQGKPLSEAKTEIIYGASFIEWFSEEGKRLYGDIIPSPIANSKIIVEKSPVGVCAFITPWNFPSAMITRKIGAAMAAGCTCVVKPAHETPLSALALAALAEEAGVPKGVLNIVTGTDSHNIGRVLCDSETVRKVSFTGSTDVGKILYRQCAATVKKISLELGGNAPFIVFPDADLDAAVSGAIICKYRNAGQTCVCANRFYIHEDVYDKFASKLADKVRKLKVGDGLDKGVDIGPLITPDALEKVRSHINDALGQGAKLIEGGDTHDLGGSYFKPTILGNAMEGMLIAKEETFGPVAPLFKFKDIDDVLRQANNTQFGLAAYFYAKDLALINKVYNGLEYGMVAVNTPILSTEVAPFGGVKESGIGREGSKYGLDDFIELKYVLLGGLE
ncbi:MAG: succinate-semialdehyde dehydrogenase (NADP(+)) [Micavibrio sp. TMED27]|nr:succinate-semialdehyde dehydrogenase (NADP(+)) [Micavibrio sp.]OUT89821.1 MAG: succinate-semialdehyde dehydrogenase (NADP(+)) [Micavibrio sp. TMED27]